MLLRSENSRSDWPTRKQRKSKHESRPSSICERRVYTCRRHTDFKMRHVCAYLLAAMGTNAANAANMKAILASVGVEADDKQLEIVIQKFGNKNIEKVIAEGSAYLAAMGGGGGGAVAASGAAPAGGAVFHALYRGHGTPSILRLIYIAVSE
ncbi:60S acidic ribosomal protein P2 [Penaeus vannamei]|uniref:Large ribosomal subunit protein P2 n=1 Tax=Penaeus vannamei TaxID=6689 RepID=A0A3R7PC66_PENVA|nr:60S acidic ribosomal protein P2 [Penaeus vannamei]